jgi:hypothetical protein
VHEAAPGSTSISIFAQRLSGIVSVGLKAVAFVNDTYKWSRYRAKHRDEVTASALT